MRKHNNHRTREETVSRHSRYLTHAELISARLTLAEDMLNLVLKDRGLPEPMERELEAVTRSIGELLQQALELPALRTVATYGIGKQMLDPSVGLA
jgi:hypothetical protein